MEYNVGTIVSGKNFNIKGMSYIGAPQSNTAMFMTRKVAHLLSALESVEDCLVFIETGVNVPEALLEKHAFFFSDKPQLAYASFASKYAEARFEEERKLPFLLSPNGYYYTPDVLIPEDSYIEPGCQIGPDVVIGKNARIHKGCVIRHSRIGDNFFANEYAVIGSNGFTMTEDEDGNKIRIPTMGSVIIGNNVEVGAHDDISCGSGGNTIIEDFAKIDSLVHIGHDNHICRNAEITSGTILGGFVTINEKVFIGMNSTVRNRIGIGDSAYISMASAVMMALPDGTKVLGNPARQLPPDNDKR